MTPIEIISRDYIKNHMNRNYDEQDMQRIFKEYSQDGGLYQQYEHTLVVYKTQHDHVCEFHCINAGSARDLVSAVNKFLKSINTNRYCNIGDIIDLQNLNLFLKKYNVFIVDYNNFKFTLDPDTETATINGFGEEYEGTYDPNNLSDNVLFTIAKSSKISL